MGSSGVAASRGEACPERSRRSVPGITECRSHAARLDFVADFFRLRGGFRDFEAAPL
jgi:hypothetical protein